MVTPACSNHSGAASSKSYKTYVADQKNSDVLEESGAGGNLLRKGSGTSKLISSDKL